MLKQLDHRFCPKGSPKIQALAYRESRRQFLFFRPSQETLLQLAVAKAISLESSNFFLERVPFSLEMKIA